MDTESTTLKKEFDTEDGSVITHTRKIRLLIITKDESVLDRSSGFFKRIIDGRGYFFETHVVLLIVRKVPTEQSTIRLTENVWVYMTNSRSWWRLIYDGYTLAQHQMNFINGFRADCIVAEDPFESALVGWLLKRYASRPLQIHLSEGFYDTAYVRSFSHAFLYSWMIRFLIPRANSIRARSATVLTQVKEMYPACADVAEMLPVYYDLKAWSSFIPTVDFRAEYPQFNFIILHITAMRNISHTTEVIQGVAPVLRQYPKVGLLIVGDGPLRAHYEKEVLIQKIQKQVEFIPRPKEYITLMKASHILIHLSDDSSENEVLYEAGITRLPIICARSGIGNTLFKDDVSALVVSAIDVPQITKKVQQYIASNRDRTQFALEAHGIITGEVAQDYTQYLEAYALSVTKNIQPPLIYSHSSV